ncbi:uncharacterized protein LOC114524698 [Dendronephthya gigantea]|uniref:uncharacterized protein LOC114524698 n=1 Tax=Dendronephthya gigantea TaxID=151771 RepID=UPI00106AA14F|nr:uncharacterized protein LOC114524698 [Dendronephthya gigantea]
MEKNKEQDKNKREIITFKYMKVRHVILVFILWTICHVLAFHQNLLPCEQLGDLGDYFCHLAKDHHHRLKIVYYVLLAIHILETIIALKLSRDLQFNVFDQMRWSLQTFYGGYFSLGRLVRMKARVKKQM